MKNESFPFQQHRPLETIVDGKPNLPKRLFWDYVYEDIDWKLDYVIVMARILTRGSKEEWDELIRFYSHGEVVRSLRHEIKYLPDYAIEKVCVYFQLKQEDLRCYIRNQSRKGYWI